MDRKELVVALRKHYNYSECTPDWAVIDSCAGLPGWYWVKFCAWAKRNWRKAGYAAAIIATAVLWLLIAHLALEELAR